MKATSRFRRAIWRLWALTSASQGSSALERGQAVHQGEAGEFLLPLGVKVRDFCSRPQLNTNLAHPMCLSSACRCGALGYSLNL